MMSLLTVILSSALLGAFGYAQLTPEQPRDMCKIDALVEFPDKESFDATPTPVVREVVKHNCRHLSVCAPRKFEELCRAEH